MADAAGRERFKTAYDESHELKQEGDARAVLVIGRDGKGAQYARKFSSDEGRKDGLYWPTAEGENESPLGPLIANARAEGYRRAANSSASAPYHGYVFKIRTPPAQTYPRVGTKTRPMTA